MIIVSFLNGFLCSTLLNVSSTLLNISSTLLNIGSTLLNIDFIRDRNIFLMAYQELSCFSCFFRQVRTDIILMSNKQKGCD